MVTYLHTVIHYLLFIIIIKKTHTVKLQETKSLQKILLKHFREAAVSPEDKIVHSGLL